MVAVNIQLNRFGIFAVCCVFGTLVFYSAGGPGLFQSEPKVSLKHLLCVSLEMVRAGGAKVRAVHEAGNKAGVVKGLTAEGAKEMVTEGDQQSHRAMYYGFEKAFPGIMVRSEEHDVKPIDLSLIDEPGDSCTEVDSALTGDSWVPLREVTVWIDPLDATQEYTENLTEYVTVMACIVVNERPRVGVIYRPFHGEIYWGLVGHGFSQNIVGLQEKSTVEPLTPSIVISRSHFGSTRALVEKAYETSGKSSSLFDGGGEKESAVRIVNAGGSGYKALKVLNGTYDGYVHAAAIKRWDVCAPEALAWSVGGQVTDISGEQLAYPPRGDPKINKGIVLTRHGDTDLLSRLATAMEFMKTLSTQSQGEVTKS